MTYFRSDKMVNKILIAYPINYSSIILGISFKMGSELYFYFKAKKLLEDFDNEVSFFLDPKLDIPFVSDPKYLSFLTGIVYNISS